MRCRWVQAGRGRKVLQADRLGALRQGVEQLHHALDDLDGRFVPRGDGHGALQYFLPFATLYQNTKKGQRFAPGDLDLRQPSETSRTGPAPWAVTRGGPMGRGRSRS